jgi:FtsP/CotA-like multicopper oxidase with cupredoxin domain
LITATCLALAGTVGAPRTAVAQAAQNLQQFHLRIENGRLAGNLRTIRVRRNDVVEINWSADRRTVLHLHGYDIETTVDAGRPETMSFTARATGRFPIETHDGRHTVVLYLEVHPR